MKYSTASIIALAGAANALPHPQFSLPSFSMPSFSMPSGLSGLGGLGGLSGLGGSSSGTDSGLGSGFSLPTGLSGLSGLSALTGSSGAQATPTPTAATGGSSNGTTTSYAVQETAASGANANNGASCGGTTGGTTENGVKGGTCCTDLTVVFARGTSEMGNMGSISGPPMVKAIRATLGEDRVTVQGVDYAASAAGNANMGADGGKVMAEYVQQALKQCPGTKVIVSGYSQGGMVVHNAFTNGITAADVAGAVMFGDPLKTQALPDMDTSKVKQFCGTSDFVCGGGGDGGATGSHLSYGDSASSAASFAIEAAGLTA